MPDKIKDFAAKIRAKYPTEYSDMDDATLARSVLKKYPNYSDILDPREAFDPKDTDSLVEFYSNKHGVDPEFTRRVMGQESRGKKGATSWAGARGLMQLMPATAQRYGVKNVEDPHENLNAGVQYLRESLDEFGDPAHVLASYNAGQGALRKYGYEKVRKFSNLKKGDPRRGGYAGSTGEYVDKILNGYQGKGYGANYQPQQSASLTPSVSVVSPDEISTNTSTSTFKGGEVVSVPQPKGSKSPVVKVRARAGDTIEALAARFNVAPESLKFDSPAGARPVAPLPPQQSPINQSGQPESVQPVPNAPAMGRPASPAQPHAPVQPNTQESPRFDERGFQRWVRQNQVRFDPAHGKEMRALYERVQANDLEALRVFRDYRARVQGARRQAEKEQSDNIAQAVLEQTKALNRAVSASIRGESLPSEGIGGLKLADEQAQQNQKHLRDKVSNAALNAPLIINQARDRVRQQVINEQREAYSQPGPYTPMSKEDIEAEVSSRLKRGEGQVEDPAMSLADLRMKDDAGSVQTYAIGPEDKTDTRTMDEKRRVFTRAAEQRERTERELRRQIESEIAQEFGVSRMNSRGQDAALDFEINRRLAARQKDLKERRAALSRPQPELGFTDKLKEIIQRPEQLAPFIGTGKEIVDLLALGKAAERLEAGTGTDEDEINLAEFRRKAQQPTNKGYKILDVVSNLPRFIGEMALTEGVYQTVKSGTEKLAVSGLKKLLTSEGGALLDETLARKATGALSQRAGQNLIKLSVKAPAALAGATAQSVPAGLLGTIAGTMERMLPKLQLSPEDEEGLKKIVFEPGDSFADAFRKSALDQFTEITSEHTGSLLDYIPVPARLRALKEGISRRLAKALPGTSGVSALREVLKKGGWHGVLGEMFEERVGEAMKGGLGVEPYRLLGVTPEEWATPEGRRKALDQLIVEGLSFSVPGAVNTVVSAKGAVERARAVKQGLESFLGEAANVGDTEDVLVAQMNAASDFLDRGINVQGQPLSRVERAAVQVAIVHLAQKAEELSAQEGDDVAPARGQVTPQEFAAPGDSNTRGGDSDEVTNVQDTAPVLPNQAEAGAESPEETAPVSSVDEKSSEGGKATTPVIKYKKIAPVRAEVSRESFNWETSDGQKMKADAGDWKVTHPDGSIGSVKPSIFEKTYEAIPSKQGQYVKTGTTKAQQLDQPIDIETLEGKGHGEKGDYLVTGAEGEQYIVPQKQFEEIYRPAKEPPVTRPRKGLVINQKKGASPNAKQDGENQAEKAQISEFPQQETGATEAKEPYEQTLDDFRADTIRHVTSASGKGTAHNQQSVRRHLYQLENRVGPANNLLEFRHRAAVEEALHAGKVVPANVLADYPDLQSQGQEKQAGAEAATPVAPSSPSSPSVPPVAPRPARQAEPLLNVQYGTRASDGTPVLVRDALENAPDLVRIANESADFRDYKRRLDKWFEERGGTKDSGALNQAMLDSRLFKFFDEKAGSREEALETKLRVLKAYSLESGERAVSVNGAVAEAERILQGQEKQAGAKATPSKDVQSNAQVSVDVGDSYRNKSTGSISEVRRVDDSGVTLGPRGGEGASTHALTHDRFKEIYEKTEHKFSSTQVNLPPNESRAIQNLGASFIPRSDLYLDPKDPSYGREEHPHVTVKYGLHTENAKDVRKLLADEPPVRVNFGKTSIFPGKGDTPYDVVKIDVGSPDLHRLNKKISKALKVTDTHPEYVPHVTLAYVKKGEGKKYVGRTDFEGKGVTVDRITFSSSNGETVDLPLAGKSDTPAIKEQGQGGGKISPQDEQPTATEAKRSVKTEKIDRTGLTPTQKKYLAGELEDYVDRNLFKTENYPQGKSKEESAEILAAINPKYGDSIGEKETIKVPGDGEFTVANVHAANKLHQKITGQPVEGMPKVKGAGVRVGTYQAKSQSNATFADYVASIGGDKRAFSTFKNLHKRLSVDAEAVESLGLTPGDVEGDLNTLRQKFDEERDYFKLRQKYLPEINRRISEAKSFPVLKEAVDAQLRRQHGRGRERQEAAEKEIADYTPEKYFEFNARDASDRNATHAISSARSAVRSEADIPYDWSRNVIDWFKVERQIEGDDYVDNLYLEQSKSEPANLREVADGLNALFADSPLKMARLESERLHDVENAADLVPGISIERVGDIVKVNVEGQEFLRRAFEQNRIDKGQEDSPEESDFDAAFLNPQEVKDVAKVLRGAARQLREKGYEEPDAVKVESLIEHIMSAARAGKGTAIIMGTDAPSAALSHESFHQGSHLGAVEKELEQRHSPESLKELSAHVATESWRKFHANDPQLQNASPALAVEEAAATIAGGDYDKLGITLEEAADFIEQWTSSYIAKNGPAAFDSFKRQEKNVRAAIEKAKRSSYLAAQVPSGIESGGARRVRETGRADKGRSAGGTASEVQGASPSAEGEADTGRVERLRALPKSLRKAGIEASDLAYLVYHDKSAVEDARSIIEEGGLERSIQLLLTAEVPSKRLMALHWIALRAIQNTTAELETDHPEDATHLREIQKSLIRRAAIWATEAGQTVQSMAMVQRSAEDHMLLEIDRLERERGKKVSPEDVAKALGVARNAETLLALVEAQAAEVARLDREIENARPVADKLQEEIDKLSGKLKIAEAQAARSGSLARRTEEQSRKIINLRAQLERAKRALEDERAGRRQPRRAALRRTSVQRVRSRAIDALAADESILLAEVRSYLSGTSPLKMAEPPQIAQTVSLDSELVGKLARLGALKLLRAERGALSVSDWKKEMVREFGQSLGPEIDRIHAEAITIKRDMLRQAALERSLDRIASEEGNENLTRGELLKIHGQRKTESRRLALIEAEHQKTATAFKNQQPEGLPKALAQAIASLAPDDQTAIGAAKYARSGMNKNTWASEMNTQQGLKGQELRDAYKAAGILTEKARAKVKADQNERRLDRLGVASLKRERTVALATFEQTRKASMQAQREMKQQLDILRKGKARYYVGKTFKELQAASIGIKASADASFLLRQGGRFLFANLSTPEGMKRNLQFILHGFGGFNHGSYATTMHDIESHPMFPFLQRIGIDFSRAGGGEGEDYFQSEWLHRIPLVKQTLGKVVEKSDEAYAAGLDWQRFTEGLTVANELLEKGLTWQDNRNEFEYAARIINLRTGRGDVSSSASGGVRAFRAIVTSLPLFGTRFTLSRFQLANQDFNPLAWLNAPPHARKILARNFIRYYGTLGVLIGSLALLAGASIAWSDPDDPDWLKLRIGDKTYDLFSGELQILRATLRSGQALYRQYELGGDFGIAFDDIFGMGANDMGILPQLFTDKLRPDAAMALDLLRQRQRGNKKLSLKDAALNSFLPISVGNTVKTLRERGVKAEGIKSVLGTTPADVLGVGVNQYEPKERPRTTAEKLAVRLAFSGSSAEEARDEQEIENSNALAKLKERSRAGENVDSELLSLMEQGAITGKQADRIRDARGKSILEDIAPRLSLENVKRIYSVATPVEQGQLEPIIAAKEKGEEKSAKAEPYKIASTRVERNIKPPLQVEAELKRLKGEDVEPPDVSRKITVAGRERELTPQEYERYRRSYLDTLYQRLPALIKSPEYQQLPDERKERVLKMQQRAVSEAALSSIRAELMPGSSRAEREAKKASGALEDMDLDQMLRRERRRERRMESYER
jgi:2'-5' RNA ligase